ncbi:hypothetical protein U1Q18_030643 [Sarracenia purpurea var. burkii]
MEDGGSGRESAYSFGLVILRQSDEDVAMEGWRKWKGECRRKEDGIISPYPAHAPVDIAFNPLLGIDQELPSAFIPTEALVVVRLFSGLRLCLNLL